MILDDLQHASVYCALGPGVALALRFLQETDLTALAAGRHAILDTRVFALVSDYETKVLEEGRWEAHRQHVDVQYIHRGQERIGYAPLAMLHAGPYDDARDVLFAEGTGELAVLRPGRFVILYPHDAHMPGLAVQVPDVVRKVVLKVAIELARPAVTSPVAAPAR